MTAETSQSGSGSAVSAQRRSGIPRLSRLPVPASVQKPAGTVAAAPTDDSGPRLAVPRVRPRLAGAPLQNAEVNSLMGKHTSQGSGTPFRSGTKPAGLLSAASLAPSPLSPRPSAANLRSARPSSAVNARDSSKSPPPGAVPNIPKAAATVRGPRPSLSDRTVETLSLLPGSPAGAAARGRRTSSFFTPMDSVSDGCPAKGNIGSRRVSTITSPRSRPTAPSMLGSSRSGTPTGKYATLRARPSNPRFESQSQSWFQPPAPPTSAASNRPRLAGTRTAHPRLAPAKSAIGLSSRNGLADLFSPPTSEEQSQQPPSPAGMVLVVGSPSGPKSTSHIRMQSRSPTRTPTRSPVRMSPTLRSPKTPKSNASPAFKSGSPVVVLADFPVLKSPPTIGRAGAPAKSTWSRDLPANSKPEQPSHRTKPTKPGPTSNRPSAFQQQIRKAKAAHRNEAGSAVPKPRPAVPLPSADFDSITDPFNQMGLDSNPDVKTRVASARDSGRLNLAGLNLSSLPDEVIQMFDYDHPANKDVDWASVVDLIRLNASDNDIAEFPSSLFPDVAAPKVSGNFWDDSGDTTLGSDSQPSHSPFCSLETVNFTGNQLSALPIGFRRLDQLTSLNLTRNNLSSDCFDVIADLPALRDLRLSGNAVTGTLPESIFRITCLESLELRDNHVTGIPPGLLALFRLRVLDLSGNRLTELPMAELSQLPLLRDFSAARNRLSGPMVQPDVTLGPNAFPSLVTLDLSVNGLTSVFAPSSSDLPLPFPVITSLSLSHNSLTSLPSLRSAPKLATLLVSDNSISALPAGFTHLSSLRTVSLANNSLRDLAPEDNDFGRFARMTCLVQLDLSGNPLRERRLAGLSIDKIRERLQAMDELADKMTGPENQSDEGKSTAKSSDGSGGFGLSFGGLMGW